VDRQQKETAFVLVHSQEKVLVREVLQVRWRSCVQEVKEKVQVNYKMHIRILSCL